MPARVSSDTSRDGVYSRLRDQALSTKRVEIGIPDPPSEAPVWGVLMETDYDGMTASLFALLDGTTSLYFSNGGGVIGGHAHEEVRQANAAFIQAGNKFKNDLQPCNSYPIPETNCTVFYVLTDAGILTAGAPENDFGNGAHLLSPLFYAGHDVITQLRLISNDTESADS